MKRNAIFLLAAAVITCMFIVSRLSDSSSSGSAPWQPDDGTSQGYIVDIYADSIVTASAPGSPVRVITTAHLDSAAAMSTVAGQEAPEISTGSPLLDAAWRLAATRLSGEAPTPYNIIFSPLLSTGGSNTADRVAAAMMEAKDTSSLWPMADTRRLLRIIALGRITAIRPDGPWIRKAAAMAQEILASDSSRLFRRHTGLWAGGGSDYMAGAIPDWADEADRFNIAALSVNALAAEAYAALARMQQLAGYNSTDASRCAKELACAIRDNLWMPTEGYFSQYIYGRLQQIQGPAASGMGNALAAASPLISSDEMARRITAQLPRTPYGITSSFPLSFGTTAHHYSIVSQGLWAFACQRGANDRAFWGALAVLLRHVALASTGDLPERPEVWSAFTGAVGGILFGLEPVERGIYLNPVVPTELGGEKTMHGLRYGQATLDITLVGSGSKIATALLDGVELPDRIIPAGLTGNHSIRVEMIDPQMQPPAIPVPMVIPRTMVPTPAIVWTSPSKGRDTVARPTYATPEAMASFVNGMREEDHESGGYVTLPARGGYTEWLLVPLDNRQRPIGFSAEPHATVSRGSTLMLQAEWFKARELARDVYRRKLRHWRRMKARNRTDHSSRPNRRLTQIVELTSEQDLTFTAEAPIATDCAIIIGYADGRDAGQPGPLLRSVSVNGVRIASVPMPRRGVPSDTTVTRTTVPLAVKLRGGINNITISTTDADINPSAPFDTVMIDFLRIIPLD